MPLRAAPRVMACGGKDVAKILAIPRKPNYLAAACADGCNLAALTFSQACTSRIHIRKGTWPFGSHGGPCTVEPPRSRPYMNATIHMGIANPKMAKKLDSHRIRNDSVLQAELPGPGLVLPRICPDLYRFVECPAGPGLVFPRAVPNVLS